MLWINCSPNVSSPVCHLCHLRSQQRCSHGVITVSSVVKGWLLRIWWSGLPLSLSQSTVANCPPVFNVEPSLLCCCTFSTSSSRRRDGGNGDRRMTHPLASLTLTIYQRPSFNFDSSTFLSHWWSCCKSCCCIQPLSSGAAITVTRALTWCSPHHSHSNHPFASCTEATTALYAATVTACWSWTINHFNSLNIWKVSTVLNYI